MIRSQSENVEVKPVSVTKGKVGLTNVMQAMPCFLILLPLMLGCGDKVNSEKINEGEPKPSQVSSSSSKPSVQEAVRFIFNRATIGLAESPGETLGSSSLTLNEKNHCQIKVSATSTDYSAQTIELEVDFSLLNPDAVSSSQSSHAWETRARATNAESIVRGVTRYENSNTSPISSQYLVLILLEEDERDAKKVSEALRYTITQCGGHEDLFSGNDRDSADKNHPRVP